MAKTNGPLFSMDASGKFAGALVYSKWKGRPTVRQLVTPSNPNSADQEAARNRVRSGGVAQRQTNLTADILNGETETDKARLITAAPPGQAWNGYLVKSMVGAGFGNYTAAQAAWGALTAPQKTDWSNAAEARSPAFTTVNQTAAGGIPATALTTGNAYFLTMYALYIAGLYTLPGVVPPTYA